MLSDSQLLKRYASDRSECDFEELIRRHADLVYATALRQLNGDVHLARDVAQIVFTDLARKAASILDHQSPPPGFHFHALRLRQNSSAPNRTPHPGRSRFAMNENHDPLPLDPAQPSLIEEAMLELDEGSGRSFPFLRIRDFNRWALP
jgi:DNA-directed RNA polymerase specialized sigma24 family protein